MVQCISPGCRSRSDYRHWRTNPTTVTFHRFPKDENMRRLYCSILGIDINRLVDASRICSFHFAKECFDIKGKRTFLKIGALPSQPTNKENETFVEGVRDMENIKHDTSEKRQESLNAVGNTSEIPDYAVNIDDKLIKIEETCFQGPDENIVKTEINFYVVDVKNSEREESLFGRTISDDSDPLEDPRARMFPNDRIDSRDSKDDKQSEKAVLV